MPPAIPFWQPHSPLHPPLNPLPLFHPTFLSCLSLLSHPPRSPYHYPHLLHLFHRPGCYTGIPPISQALLPHQSASRTAACGNPVHDEYDSSHGLRQKIKVRRWNRPDSVSIRRRKPLPAGYRNKFSCSLHREASPLFHHRTSRSPCSSDKMPATPAD